MLVVKCGARWWCALFSGMSDPTADPAKYSAALPGLVANLNIVSMQIGGGAANRREERPQDALLQSQKSAQGTHPTSKATPPKSLSSNISFFFPSRHLCLCCALLVKDEDFAKAFAEEGGMDGLMGVAAQATGNVQTYALVALRVAISHSSGPAPASPASLLPPQRLLS